MANGVYTVRSISFPNKDLLDDAVARANQLGVSFSKYVTLLIEQDLAENEGALTVRDLVRTPAKEPVIRPEPQQPSGVQFNADVPPYRVSSERRRPAPSSAGMEGDALAGAVAAGQGQGAARPPRSSTVLPSGSKPEPGPRSRRPSSRGEPGPEPAPPSRGNRGAAAADRRAGSSLKDSRPHAIPSGKTSAGDQ